MAVDDGAVAIEQAALAQKRRAGGGFVALEVAMQVILGVIGRVHDGIVDARIGHAHPTHAIGIVGHERIGIAIVLLGDGVELVVGSPVFADLHEDERHACDDDDDADDFDDEQRAALARLAVVFALSHV